MFFLAASSCSKLNRYHVNNLFMNQSIWWSIFFDETLIF
jgi:hypothetical protein